MVQKNCLNKVLIISGATGTGKSSLAIQCAKFFNGEIISADSMQIYQDFDIGTAKIPEKERQGIPHYLIDIKNGKQLYSACEFKTDTYEKIRDIQKRNKLPIIVGGTGLYINTILFNYEFGGKGTYKRGEPDFDITTVVLDMPRSEIYDNINKRVDLMIEDGLIKEISSLLKKGYSFDDAPFRAIGYKEFKPYFLENQNLNVCVEKLKQNTRNYAKRQITWFKQWKDFAIYLNPYDKDILKIIKEKLFF